jgi:hypothetical protein
MLASWALLGVRADDISGIVGRRLDFKRRPSGDLTGVDG